MGEAAEPPLPGYALGQPLSDARQVVPNGQSRATWVLRCAGDPAAPAELVVSSADQAAARMLCWPMRITPAGEVRAATPPTRGDAVQELEFRGGRIVRISKDWHTDAGLTGSITYRDGALPKP